MLHAIARAATLLVATTLPALAQPADNPSFLDSLDHTTPEAVAAEFVAAMRDTDYFEAYYLLSPEAKDGLRQVVGRVDFSPLLPGLEKFSLPGSIFFDKSVPRELLDDVMADQSRVFDDMMVAGLTSGHLPFSFADATLGAVSESGDSATAEVAAEPALTLGLAKTEWGEWRVDTIGWDGSVDGRPWGAAAGTTTAAAAELPAGPRSFVDGLSFDTPEATAAYFADAFAAGDYFGAYFAFSPEAKTAWLDDRKPLMLEQFIPGIDRNDLPGTGLYRPDVKRADALAFDVMYDKAVTFHRLLQAADHQGVLPFKLDSAALAAPEVTLNTATIAAGTEPAGLTLHLLQLPNDQWRIDQITWDGSLDRAKPWAGEYTPAAN